MNPPADTQPPNELLRARLLGQLYGLDNLVSTHMQAHICLSHRTGGIVATRQDQTLAARLHHELHTTTDPLRKAALAEIWETPHNPDELLTTYRNTVAASGRLDAAAQLALLPRDTRALTLHEHS